MESYVRDFLPSGLIRPSTYPLGAGFFFMTKKDKTLRPSIDFRWLNNIMITNHYHLPLLHTAFEPLNQAAVSTKLDLRNAYYLVRDINLSTYTLMIFPERPLNMSNRFFSSC